MKPHLPTTVFFTFLSCVLFAVTGTLDTSTGLYYTISDGEATVTGLSDAASVYISIPSKLGGATVTSIDKNAFAGNTGIQYLVLPSTITTIGENCLKGCVGLTDVVFRFPPNSAGLTDADPGYTGFTAYYDISSSSVKSAWETFLKNAGGDFIAYPIYITDADAAMDEGPQKTYEPVIDVSPVYFTGSATVKIYFYNWAKDKSYKFGYTTGDSYPGSGTYAKYDATNAISFTVTSDTVIKARGFDSSGNPRSVIRTAMAINKVPLYRALGFSEDPSFTPSTGSATYLRAKQSPVDGKSENILETKRMFPGQYVEFSLLCVLEEPSKLSCDYCDYRDCEDSLPSSALSVRVQKTNKDGEDLLGSGSDPWQHFDVSDNKWSTATISASAGDIPKGTYWVSIHYAIPADATGDEYNGCFSNFKATPSASGSVSLSNTELVKSAGTSVTATFSRTDASSGATYNITALPASAAGAVELSQESLTLESGERSGTFTISPTGTLPSETGLALDDGYYTIGLPVSITITNSSDSNDTYSTTVNVLNDAFEITIPTGWNLGLYPYSEAPDASGLAFYMLNAASRAFTRVDTPVAGNKYWVYNNTGSIVTLKGLIHIPLSDIDDYPTTAVWNLFGYFPAFGHSLPHDTWEWDGAKYRPVSEEESFSAFQGYWMKSAN